jgi:hypothetical protein
MAQYATLTEIKAMLPESGLASSTDYDDMLNSLSIAASRLIDREVGRGDGYFYPSTADYTRYYDGSGETSLWIDETVSITTVKVAEDGGISSSDYTTWSSTDFIAWPYNYSQIGMPIMRLDVDRLNGSKMYWNAYRKSVSITGVFGYSITPPADIVQACIIQVVRWFMRAKQAFQDAGAAPELGQLFYTRKLDPDVALILEPYRTSSIQ